MQIEVEKLDRVEYLQEKIGPKRRKKLIANNGSYVVFLQYSATRKELCDMLPHLAAWCETGSLEVKSDAK